MLLKVFSLSVGAGLRRSHVLVGTGAVLRTQVVRLGPSRLPAIQTRARPMTTVILLTLPRALRQ